MLGLESGRLMARRSRRANQRSLRQAKPPAFGAHRSTWSTARLAPPARVPAHMSKPLPQHAEIVIVGGGVVGASIAYHLTLLGKRDVVLIERKRLTSGTTWHAAGLVGQLRATANLTKLAQYTTNLYASLEAETGQATGFLQRGSISIATNAERLEELKRGASMAKTFGLEVHEVSPAEIKKKWPLLNVDDVAGGVFLPNDGQTNPIDTTMALIKGATMRGARVFENVKVASIKSDGKRARGVVTDQGEITAETSSCSRPASGRARLRPAPASPRRCKPASISISSPSPSPASPTICPCCAIPTIAPITKKTPASCCSAPSSLTRSPGRSTDLPRISNSANCPRISIISRRSSRRRCAACRRFENVGIRKFFNGPESFTPDVRYMLGEAPEFRATVRRRRLQFDRHPIRRRRGQGARRMDRRGPSADGPLGHRHPPPAALPGQQGLSRRARDGIARPALRDALALSAIRDRAQFAPFAAASATGRSRRVFRRSRGLGARQLVRAEPGERPVYRYSYGRQNWFEPSARGTSRRARSRSASST